MKGRNIFLFKVLSFLLLAGFLIYPYSASGQETHSCQNRIVNWNTQPIQKNKIYKYEIDPKFSLYNRALIQKALEIAIDRMQEKSVWQEIKSNYKFAFPTTKTINNSGFCNDLEIRRNLIFHQLYYLAVPEGNKISSKKLPDVTIYYGNEPPAEGELGWLGKAHYDLVNIYWSSATNRWQKSGSFKISINAYFLGKNEMYSSADYWAGIIAHEMAHNLGHRHPLSTDPTYNTYQINVLASAIQNFGQASAGPAQPKYPIYACNGK